MPFLTVLRSLSSILILLTSVCYFYQILYLFIPLLGKKKPAKKAELRRYAILIAARNEEAVLPHLLESIRAQDYPAELISTFVVADNCTDATAEVARAGGATVYTRFNKQRVGKGYALNYLLEHIERDFGPDRFDAFLIFDADNLLKSDYVTQINRLPSEGFEAFCGYRNTKNFGTNWISSGYGVWYLHESTHMNRSRYRIGSSCSVSGTGFGFTGALLKRLGGWNFFTLTEDIEFSNWCASNGVKIGYCHDAVAYDEQPVTLRQSWKQRTRWVQGGIQVSFRYARRLCRGFFKGGWTGYACFELATLSLWGYLLAGATGILSFLLAVLSARWAGAAFALVTAFAGAYGSLFAMAVLTLLLEWKRIHATTAQKLRSAFTYPFFMMTYIPIGICAVFRKFEWAPIAHTVAVSASEFSEK